MQQHIIEELKKRAIRIAWHVGRRYGGDFAGLRWEQIESGEFDYDLPAPGEVSFYPRGNTYAKITFKGVSPSAVERKLIHDPQTIGEKVNDVSTSNVINESGNDIERSYTFTQEESKSFNESVGVTAGFELRQMFGYGGELYGFTGETEFTVSLESEYSKEWGGEESISRETSTSVVIPPNKEGIFTTRNSTSRYEQHCEYWCGLEHEVHIYSHGDFNHVYGSYRELLDTTKGLSPNTVPEAARWRHNPLNAGDQAWITTNPTVHFEETLTFDKAIKGHVHFKTQDYES